MDVHRNHMGRTAINSSTSITQKYLKCRDYPLNFYDLPDSSHLLKGKTATEGHDVTRTRSKVNVTVYNHGLTGNALTSEYLR